MEKESQDLVPVKNQKTLSETEAKLLNHLLSVEQENCRLKSQLLLESIEKSVQRKKYAVLESMGLQMGKGLIEIIQDMTTGLLKVKEDVGGGQTQDDADMEILRKRIPMALNILKEKIQRVDFDKEDKEMLEDLRKMINIFVLRRKVEECAADDQPEPDVTDCGGTNMEWTPIVESIRIIGFKSEPSILDQPEVPVLPSQQPVYSGMGKKIDLDSEDDDVIFVEEIERPSTKETIPRIISTYSVPLIKDELTTPSTSSHLPSENEECEENAGVRPSTPASQPIKRQVAVKKTGGAVRKVEKQENQKKRQVRRSPRTFKSMGMPETSKQTVQDSKKAPHAIHPNNSGECLCGFKSSAVNVESHVCLLNGGHHRLGPGHPKASNSTKKPKMDSASKKRPLSKTGASTKVSIDVKEQQHYLVEVEGSSRYHCACGKAYVSESALLNHVKNLTKDMKFECFICKRSYYYYSCLTNHLKAVHKVVSYDLH